MKTKRILAVIVMILGMLYCQDAFAFYNSSAGRWLSRDPIGEEAFFESHAGDSESQQQNMEQQALMPPYLVVRNNPVNRVDLFGLYDDCCCDASTIDKGRRKLLGRYRIAETYLDPHRPFRMPETGSWSCLSVALNVGLFMAKIPPCWTCYMEERWQGRIIIGYRHDLNVVVCQSHPQSGAPQKIFFDYWHHARPGQDYSVFLKKYPDPGAVFPNLPEVDCSKPYVWLPNYKILDVIIAGP
jgi:hypothetical protein